VRALSLTIVSLVGPSVALAYPLDQEVVRLAGDRSSFISISEDPCGMTRDGGLADVTAEQLAGLSASRSLVELAATWNADRPQRPVRVEEGEGWVEMQVDGLAEDCLTPVLAPTPWNAVVPPGLYDGHEGLERMFAVAGANVLVVDHQAIRNRSWSVPMGGARLREVLLHYTSSATKGVVTTASAHIAPHRDGAFRVTVSLRNRTVAPLGELPVSDDPETARLQTAKLQLEELRGWVETKKYLAYGEKMAHYPQLLVEEEAYLRQLESEFLENHESLPYEGP